MGEEKCSESSVDATSPSADHQPSSQISKVLVVDTGGFIKNAPLRSLAERVVTLRDVVAEIKDKATRQRLQVLPYELDFVEPDAEDIKTVSDFARKTGDYHVLSATDLRVLALTLRLEREATNGDVSHLRKEPLAPRPKLNFYHPASKKEAEKKAELDTKLPGFYVPEHEDEEEDEEVDDGEDAGDGDDDQPASPTHTEADEENVRTELNKLDLRAADCDQSETQKGFVEAEEDNLIESGEEEEEEDDDEEDDGWITPGNVGRARRAMTTVNGNNTEPLQRVEVACMTTDFAMQNVLVQMGLRVASADGMLIRGVRTWLMRCYACFKVTSKMDSRFCPKCGNETLKRVACTLNDDGSTQIHISTRRRLTGRGKKFSLPAPKGGKHAVNPRLTADAGTPQQRLSKAARTRTDALSEDYTAGNAPFAMHDVTSRSAMLGVPGVGAKANLYWMRSNPNVVSKRTGNRRKKKAL